MEINPMARLIKKYRVEKKISQSDLATKFGYTSKQHISNIERGGACSPDMMARISRHLSIPQEEFQNAFFSERASSANKIWNRLKRIITHKKGETK